LECAGFLAGLGYETSLMIRSRPLKYFDEDLAELVINQMATDEGVKVLRDCEPISIGRLPASSTDDDMLKLTYKEINTGIVKEATLNSILFATGNAIHSLCHGDINDLTTPV
jgi:thioredoxin reductase (NADPH)